jgi:hypothetical protein
MNYKEFTLGCITVIIIVLIVIGFIYPNTIYDFGMISLTAISTIAWVILYISTRTLHCTQKENPKGLICEIKGGNIEQELIDTVKKNYNLAMNIKKEYEKITTNKKDHDKILSLFKTIQNNKQRFDFQLNKIKENTDVTNFDSIARSNATRITEALNKILKHKNPDLTEAVKTVKADNKATGDDIVDYADADADADADVINVVDDKVDDDDGDANDDKVDDDDTVTNTIPQNTAETANNTTQKQAAETTNAIMQQAIEKATTIVTNKDNAGVNNDAVNKANDDANNDDVDDDVDDDVVYYLSQQQSEKVSEPYKPSKSYGSDNTNFDKFYNKTINNNLI